VELTRSNQDLQQFAYVASHDLQEPLRMVSSYTQLLGDRYRDQLDEKGQSFIHYAVDGAVRMQRLIQDLLAFSRVKTHGEPFDLLDLNDLMTDVLANLESSVNESGGKVIWDTLPSVPADRSQLGQVFLNLVGNALKFRGESAPKVHIGSSQEQDLWQISVQDNGIGIDEKYADKIFVIFQRLHTRDVYPGTGIGLALCKQIITRHGGQIWFESEPGKGSTFFFTLPMKQ
jgi:light-regulated signal transduction histidine kinase (bacteriophytochrome)